MTPLAKFHPPQNTLTYTGTSARMHTNTHTHTQDKVLSYLAINIELKTMHYKYRYIDTHKHTVR